MLIDTHTHYNFAGIKENWRASWELAQAKGVTHAIQIGTDTHTSKEVVEMAAKEENFFASVGCHPHDLANFDLGQIKQLAKHDKVIAIGEIGLDYFRLDKNSEDFNQIKNQQIEAFTAQVELANSLKLPIIVHVRDDGDRAYQDVLDVFTTHPPTQNFVLHCVSGPEFYIKAMIEKNAWFGFDGNITYKNADRIREILKQVPKDKIVIETDAPFLPPVPYRGKACEPWMLVLTAKYLNENFAITTEMLEKNTLQLFQKLVQKPA